MKTLLLILLCTTSVCAQVIQRQTFSAVGTSVQLSNQLIISQSIGQMSVNGMSAQQSVVVQQGYQQSMVSAIFPITTFSPVAIKNFPNPFVNEINVSFSQAIKDPVTIVVSDLFGKVLYQNTFSNPQNGVGFKVANLAPNAYILTITGTNLNYSNKIIKVN